MPHKPASPCRIPGCPNLRPCSVHPPPKPFESSTPRRRYGRSGWAYQRTVQAVLKRDGGICRLRLPGCAIQATTADHIISPRRGGTDELDNLRAACESCNKARMRQQAAEARR